MTQPIVAFVFALILTASGCARQAAPADEGHSEHQAAPSQAASPAATSAQTVELDPRSVALANVATARIVRRPFATVVTAAGRVTYDEQRLARVTAWVDGRIDKLRVATTGAVIRKGQPIAELYSPDLISTQQELLLAAASAKELAGSSVPGVAEDARRLVAVSRKRLRLWGLSDAQIDGVLRRGQPLETMPVLSPATGVVLRRMVQAGDWVDKGMTLFEVADLSRVWVEADAYEYELAGLRPGLPVTVETLAYPGRSFLGRVAFVEPVMKADTRTNTLRIELANPGGLLKPDMFVTATVRVQRGSRLVAPTDAVVDTGKRQLVWVADAPGRFVAREVKVGAQSDDGFEILEGLREGETIAASGGFLLDASSQLNRGGGAHAGHGTKSVPASPAAPDGASGHTGH